MGSTPHSACGVEPFANRRCCRPRALTTTASAAGTPPSTRNHSASAYERVPPNAGNRSDHGRGRPLLVVIRYSGALTVQTIANEVARLLPLSGPVRVRPQVRGKFILAGQET